jgi:predicted RNA-binding protein YlqC (UPF0109 family)
MRDRRSGAVAGMVGLLVRSFVDHPEEVQVSEASRSDTVVVELRVDPEDMGKVIGRQGRTARALRSLVGLAGEKLGCRALLRILE